MNEITTYQWFVCLLFSVENRNSLFLDILVYNIFFQFTVFFFLQFSNWRLWKSGHYNYVLVICFKIKIYAKKKKKTFHFSCLSINIVKSSPSNFYDLTSAKRKRKERRKRKVETTRYNSYERGRRLIYAIVRHPTPMF